MYTKEHSTHLSDVLILGSGGAGLRAAIEVRLAGLKVSVLGKRNKNDVHTVLAAGGINAAFGNLDPKDSWEQHFADTYLEGYGIGEPLLVELMAKESPILVREIDEWGANFAKTKDGKLDQRFFGAHTYRRTCYSGDYTGQSILNSLLSKASLLGIPIYDSQYVTELLIKDGICCGAMSFNTNNAERTIHLADAVVICTGGHTRIWKKSSSRKYENTGDGFYLALNAGCELKDMEMVQFHPTGMLLPEDIAGTLVTEAVRGEGGKLFNGNGERFMVNYDKDRMELSTRDRVAMANYTEIVEGRSTANGGVYLDISHKDKEFILEKIPNIYKQFLDTQNVDISREPMEVAPTAHYSMGGIVVSAEEHATCIAGLYAAGEVAGGLHGANRLGGNSLAEILVFGKRAGKAAASYSKKLNSKLECDKAIDLAHNNLNILIKRGKESAIALQNSLSNIMWEYCGVVKDEKKLKEGLTKISEIKTLAKDVGVNIQFNSCKDLILHIDLNASIISAEATIMSAIKREESRGAHQRSDYRNISNLYNCNHIVVLESDSLKVSSKPTQALTHELSGIIKEARIVSNTKGKLLE